MAWRAAVQKWIDRVLRREDINGGTDCPTYLTRWVLLCIGKGFAIYLHKFVADDVSRDPHDHPKRFISIGLWGSYIEEVSLGVFGGCVREVRYSAPWIRSFPAEHIHRIKLVEGKVCWTLVITLWQTREWGFWHNGAWWHWRKYIASGRAVESKSC